MIKNKVMRFLRSGLVLVLVVATSLLLPVATHAAQKALPCRQKVVIVGGGFLAAMQTYYLWRAAQQKNIELSVTIYEKNRCLAETTAMHIFPGLTPGEILFGAKELAADYEKSFHEGGIRVDDVPALQDSAVAQKFIQEAALHAQDGIGHHDRITLLMALGKQSMRLWQELYESADSELTAILDEACFNPCREPSNTLARVLHDGYRIDLLYNKDNPIGRVQGIIKTQAKLGFTHCSLLSPLEVAALDPSLIDFCAQHSLVDAYGQVTWTADAAAFWRPGGCLDSAIFLPKFYDYLKRVMGTSCDAQGNLADALQIHLGREITGVEIASVHGEPAVISGLVFADGVVVRDDAGYFFCPGEAAGTLARLGFDEPLAARFAGASLKLVVPIPDEMTQLYKGINHSMLVHKDKVAASWQARFKDNAVHIGVAGRKALYADQVPTLEQAFAQESHLAQLNIANDLLPDCLSLALGRDTLGQALTAADLDILQAAGVATRWVGSRAVAFDGFPTLGRLSMSGREVANAFVATHAGSGGVSFAPIFALMNSKIFCGDAAALGLVEQEVLRYADCSRG